MANLISQNSISAIYNSTGGKDAVVQVLDVKQVQGQQPQAGERYRLVISDSKHFIQAMLTTGLNGYIRNGTLVKNSLIRLKDFVCKPIHGRRIVIILDLEPVPSNITTIIGTPQNIEIAASGGQQPVRNVGSPQSTPAMTQAPTQLAPPAQPQPMQQPPRPVASPTASTASPNPGRAKAAPVAPGSLDLSQQPIIPIAQLSPYLPKFTIRARVTAKSERRTWSNAKGSGSLFSIDLLDDSGEIRATAFNDTVDLLYDYFQVGHVYLIHRGQIKFANKKFTSINHDYELTLEPQTVVQEIVDNGEIPQNNFTFVSISDIKDKGKDDIVDVIGVLEDVKALSQITSRVSNSQISKREIVLCDDGARIEITLWGEKAESFSQQPGTVIAFKNLRVSDFGGKTLGTTSSSAIVINPAIPRAHQLSQWFMQSGGSVSVESLSLRGGSVGPARIYTERTLADIDQLSLGRAAPDFISVRGTVWHIKTNASNLWYPACPACNRKVTAESDGFRCYKCNKTTPTCIYRYILQLSISDHTANKWVSAFDEAAKVVVGYDANTMNAWRENHNPNFEYAFEEAKFKTFNFKIKVSMEEYQGDQRVRVNIVQATPIDYSAESRSLIAKIKELQQ